jgi:hypothetical protein
MDWSINAPDLEKPFLREMQTPPQSMNIKYLCHFSPPEFSPESHYVIYLFQTR